MTGVVDFAAGGVFHMSVLERLCLEQDITSIG